MGFGKGFTLVELLAVIVVLAVLSIVTVPLIMNSIETAKRNAFISSAKNVLDATDLYTSKGGEISFDGLSIQNLDIKKKDLYEGLVFVRTDDLKILKDFTDGNYCANGTKNNLNVTKGTCKSTGLYPVVKVQLKEITSKSITIEVDAKDTIGIQSYSYCLEHCEEEGSWTTTKEPQYTFQNLTHHRLYELHIKVKNQIEHVTEEVIQASTFEVPAPTYVIEPSGWSRSKKVTITYPEAYDHYYQVTEGTVQVNGKTVVVGEKIKVKGTKVELTFQSNGRMNASVSDGYNEVTVSDLVLAQIDTENPVVTSASITSTNGNYNAVTTIISSVVSDNSGILEMYISNSGYETGGSWEAYNSSKSWNVGGTLNGGTRTVYITYRDLAGNKVNKSLTYTVYKECSNTTTTYGGWGACSKPCGGGTQTRSVTVKDNATNKTCSTSTGSQACNTHSCGPAITTIPARTFDLVIPVNSTTAIGFNIGSTDCGSSTCTSSWVDATVIKQTNGSISYGNKTRILSGGNGIGYPDFFGARIDDNRVIIIGGNQRFIGSTNIYMKTIGAALVKINGTTPQVLSIVKANENNSNSIDSFACNGTYCKYYMMGNGQLVNGEMRAYIGQVQVNGDNLSIQSQIGQDWIKVSDYLHGDIENKAGGYQEGGNSAWGTYWVSNLGPGILVDSGYYQQFGSRRYDFKIAGKDMTNVVGRDTYCHFDNNKFVTTGTVYDRNTKLYTTTYYFYQYNPSSKTTTQYHSLAKTGRFNAGIPIGNACYDITNGFRITP